MGFSFIQITDHHLGQSVEDNPHRYPANRTFSSVLEHISENFPNSIDFIISTGDLVNKPDPGSYAFARSLLNLQSAENISNPHLFNFGNLKDFPLYLLPGNHDDRENFFKSLFTRTPSGGLMNTTFMHKGVRIIFLDWGEENKAQAYPETLDFLDKTLQYGDPALLFMHHNIAPLGSLWVDDFIADDIENFYKILEGKNILAIFCGHLHSSYQTRLLDIPVYGLRSTAFQFKIENKKPVPTLAEPHYRLVSLNGGSLDTQIISVPLPDELKPE